MLGKSEISICYFSEILRMHCSSGTRHTAGLLAEDLYTPADITQDRFRVAVNYTVLDADSLRIPVSVIGRISRWLQAS